MRAVGQANQNGSKNKETRLLIAVSEYLDVTQSFKKNFAKQELELPLIDLDDIAMSYDLEYYREMLEKPLLFFGHPPYG